MSQISIVHAVLSLYANITVNGDQKAITQIVSSPFQVPKADIQSISDGLSRSRQRFPSRKWRLLKQIKKPDFSESRKMCLTHQNFPLWLWIVSDLVNTWEPWSISQFDCETHFQSWSIPHSEFVNHTGSTQNNRIHKWTKWWWNYRNSPARQCNINLWQRKGADWLRFSEEGLVLLGG